MVEIIGYVNVYNKKATRNEYGWQVVLFFVSRYRRFSDFFVLQRYFDYLPNIGFSQRTLCPLDTEAMTSNGIHFFPTANRGNCKYIKTFSLFCIE